MHNDIFLSSSMSYVMDFFGFFFLHVFARTDGVGGGGFGNFRTIQPRNFNSPIAFRTLSSLTLLGQTNACELSFPNAGSRGLQACSRVFHASSGNSSYNGAEPGIWVWVASGVFAPRPNLLHIAAKTHVERKGLCKRQSLRLGFTNTLLNRFKAAKSSTC